MGDEQTTYYGFQIDCLLCYICIKRIWNKTYNRLGILQIIMTDIEELQQRIVQFTEERDWDQFHNPKDLAIALSVEAGELLECFLWKKPEEAKIEKVKEELADVFNYAILIASKYNLDIKQIVLDKLARNAEKYPVEKAKGNAKKYNEL